MSENHINNIHKNKPHTIRAKEHYVHSMRMNNLYSIHIEYVQYSVFTQLNFFARLCSLITWNWNGFNWIFTVLFTFTL